MISYEIISYEAILYALVSNKIISYEAILYEIISYKIISYEAILYEIISYDMVQDHLLQGNIVCVGLIRFGLGDTISDRTHRNKIASREIILHGMISKKSSLAR